MTAKTTKMYDLWLAAFKFCTERGPRGTKGSLADALGVSKPHLSCLLTDDPARQRVAGQAFQERAAEYYGFDILEFLDLGNHVLNGKTYFGPGFNQLEPNSRQRAAVILARALKLAHLDDVHFLTVDALIAGGAKPLKRYLAKESTDEELFSELTDEFSSISSKLASK